MNSTDIIAGRGLDALRAAIAGRVFVPGEAGYDQARQACRPQQHRAVQRFERSGAVAGALRGDPDPVDAGEPDRPGNIGGRPRLHDYGGPLVHG